MAKKGARVKPRILPAPTCKAAFSLPEVLVALTVLVVVVTVLMRVHVGTLRAGSMSKGLDDAVTELCNVAALSFLGADDDAIKEEVEAAGWVPQVASAGLTGGGAWKAWSLSSTNKPAPVVSVYVQGRQEQNGGGVKQREDGK